MAIFLPHDGAGLMTAAWLAVICAVLVRIEFEVGEGRTHPLQLAFVPMLLLLSPGAIPLVVVCAHLAAMIPKVVRQRLPARRLLLSVADSSFSLAPALVIVVAGRPDGVWSAAALCTAAIGALMLSDLAISSLRMRVGLGMDPRAELRGFAWVYLVDLCLAPIGFVAALAGRAHPAVLVAVLPLAGLLAIFARERRGRIENALELQRLAQEGRDRLQSIVQNSSDLIAILDRDGAMRTLTGSVAPIFGPDWEAAQGEHAARSRASAGRRARRGLPRRGGRKGAWRAARRRMAHALRGRHVPPHRRGGHQPARRSASGRASSSPPRRQRSQGLRGAAAPPRVPRRPDRSGQPRAVL